MKLMRMTYWYRAFIILLLFSVVACSDEDIMDDSDLNLQDKGFSKTQQVEGTMLAGEWNDLENWGFWKALLQTDRWEAKTDYWRYYPNNRYTVRLTNSAGEPLINAELELQDVDGRRLWRAKTDARGTAELWSGLFTDTNGKGGWLWIKYNEQTKYFSGLKTYDEGVNALLWNCEREEIKQIDIAFIVDATGSMIDEIAYLKQELDNVFNQIDLVLSDNWHIRVSCTFYRDDQEADFLLRTTDFSSDLGYIVNFVEQQEASGGGDYPEAVDKALREVIVLQDWNDDALARIVFLLLDAPPHNKPEVIENLHQITEVAAEKGIKIIPITSNGINKDTEFLMRFLAIATGGTYAFITRNSEDAYPDWEATIGNYQVEQLDDLMTKLVLRYSNISLDTFLELEAGQDASD